MHRTGLTPTWTEPMGKAESDYSTSQNPGAVDRLLRFFGADDDWHHLDPPEMNEALESYVTRAILRHPAVVAVTHWGRLEPMTALGRVQPAIVTLPHWERRIGRGRSG
jgi:hypothetical protein